MHAEKFLAWWRESHELSEFAATFFKLDAGTYTGQQLFAHLDCHKMPEQHTKCVPSASSGAKRRPYQRSGQRCRVCTTCLNPARKKACLNKPEVLC